jgi:hypothetical protein
LVLILTIHLSLRRDLTLKFLIHFFICALCLVSAECLAGSSCFTDLGDTVSLRLVESKKEIAQIIPKNFTVADIRWGHGEIPALKIDQLAIPPAGQWMHPFSVNRAIQLAESHLTYWTTGSGQWEELPGKIQRFYTAERGRNGIRLYFSLHIDLWYRVKPFPFKNEIRSLENIFKGHNIFNRNVVTSSSEIKDDNGRTGFRWEIRYCIELHDSEPLISPESGDLKGGVELSRESTAEVKEEAPLPPNTVSADGTGLIQPASSSTSAGRVVGDDEGAGHETKLPRAGSGASAASLRLGDSKLPSGGSQGSPGRRQGHVIIKVLPASSASPQPASSPSAIVLPESSSTTDLATPVAGTLSITPSSVALGIASALSVAMGMESAASSSSSAPVTAPEPAATPADPEPEDGEPEFVVIP